MTVGWTFFETDLGVILPMSARFGYCGLSESAVCGCLEILIAPELMAAKDLGEGEGVTIKPET